MRNPSFIFVLALVFATGQTRSSDLPPPRTPDEEHAWRLYGEYKTASKKMSDLQTTFDLAKQDTKGVAYGLFGGMAIDPKDVERMQKAKAQLNEERDRIEKLENAWEQKFSGVYGPLKDSAETIYDEGSKRTMDKIEFRLTNFRFDPFPFDGNYKGRMNTELGSFALEFKVNEQKVSGKVTGTLQYKIFGETSTFSIDEELSGSISEKGQITTALKGKIKDTDGKGKTKDISVTGSLTGAIAKTKDGKSANGKWTWKAESAANGTWSAEAIAGK